MKKIQMKETTKRLKKRTSTQKKKTSRPIKFRRSLFWDVDPKTIHPEKHARYIIERILDFGTDDEVRWMWGAYDRALIREVVKSSRVLHKQTRPLWDLLTARR